VSTPLISSIYWWLSMCFPHCPCGSRKYRRSSCPPRAQPLSRNASNWACSCSRGVSSTSEMSAAIEPEQGHLGAELEGVGVDKERWESDRVWSLHRVLREQRLEALITYGWEKKRERRKGGKKQAVEVLGSCGRIQILTLEATRRQPKGQGKEVRSRKWKSTF
jgi:hypothetical protein